MGGGDAGPINQEEHDYALWEKRVDALYLLAAEKGIFTVDALRRVLEDMGPQAYETMTYYERWIASINQNLLEQGIYTPLELGEKMEEVARRGQSYAEASRDG